MRRMPVGTQADRRRGAAVVEFAIIAPVFLTLILGLVEGGTALECSNLLSAAVREGGRLAAMDWTSVVPDGTTANDKVADDIRNFLTAAGLAGAQAQISITHAEGSNQGEYFDLSDPDNRLKLFRISAQIPYDVVSTYPSTFMSGQTVTASIVLRAGRVTLVN